MAESKSKKILKLILKLVLSAVAIVLIFRKIDIDKVLTNDYTELYKLLDNSDDDLTKCVLNKDTRVKIPNNNVVNLLKNFRID